MTNSEIDPKLYLERYPALASLPENANTNTFRQNLLVRCGETLRHASKSVDGQDNTVLPDADTRLRPDNPLLHRKGFEPIPVDKIGLYQDTYRKLL